MSTAEIIEKIKALSPEDQAKLSAFLAGLNAESTEALQPRYVDPEKARVIADRAFEENAELFRKLAK